MKRYRTVRKLMCDLVGSQFVVRGRGKTIVMSIILSFLLLSEWTDGVLADVTISPTTLYFSKMNPRGRVTIVNGDIDAKIVDVSLSFGYPVSDNDGNISFRFIDSTNNVESSMRSWVRVYPCHFELAPNEYQVVTIVAEPPEELPDGEYWLRPKLIVRSIDSLYQTNESPDRLRLNTKEIHQYILSVNYRHGIAWTGISIRNISATVRGKRLRLLVALQREGNAAYRGNIVCSLWGADGHCLVDRKREVAVYHSLNHRFEFEVGDVGFSDGAYTAQIELNTDRQGDVLRSPPVNRTFTFKIKKGVAIDNLANDIKIITTPLSEKNPSLLRFERSVQGSLHKITEDTVACQSPETTHVAQFRDRFDALVESHKKVRTLEKRLKEINREQDMILRELRKLTVIIQ
ncbi:MAG: hypothetical protein HY707_09575 [Ignavibacteriae bacterium]|nr:hypothetical protein [Ignavibacteriota bacterium]